MQPQDLIDHFNLLFAQQLETLPSLPKTQFFWRDGQFFARFGGLVFGNKFIPIIAQSSQKLVGYESEFWVQTALGTHIAAADVFATLSDLSEVVFLDRATRTLQALNYSLLENHCAALLSLGIQTRHILGVPSGHGRTFDTILSDCGLASANVLLHTAIPTAEHFEHVRRALFSYQAYGYKIGLQINNADDWAHFCAWDIDVDYLLLRPGAPTNSTGVKIIRANPGHFVLAQAAEELSIQAI